MRTPLKLVWRHLREHWARSLITIAALSLAFFLLCFVRSVVTSLDAAVSTAAADRLIVQSAVSLFVNLPLDYQSKIESVPGVDEVSKMQWFGGYYRDENQFFAQFAVDQDVYFDMYARDMRIVEGPHGETGEAARAAALAALAGDRRACLVGTGLLREFGDWAVGRTVSLQSGIFTKADGSAWDFVIVGVYEPLKSNVDDRTLFFRYDYLKETLVAQGLTGDLGTGVYVVDLAPGVATATAAEAIDGRFANGPQRTKTTTEAAFQALFVNMLGNVPTFLGSIGGAVVFALFFSVVNTMLMAGRQRRAECGILKALGFPDVVVGRLLLLESLALCVIGGGLGLVLAKLTAEPLRRVMGSNLPGYDVQWTTIGFGLAATLVVGLVSGLGPALSARRLAPVEALRSEG